MKYPPINKNFCHMLHGADYNPEQWMATRQIWDEDIRLMKLSHCNTMSIGIFSWSDLEPEEGKYDFGWLDYIMDMFEKNGIHAVLATPSGARPAWLSAKYPEVLRVGANRVRNLHGGRHNHCFTSPVYREKTSAINRKLAERYKDHNALLVWHISNELQGDCHCELCQAAFRKWLQDKYDGDLEKLNEAWWTHFWSHRYTDWSQIESPAPHGESNVHGHNLDWKRFVTDQTIDFYKNEIVPIRKLTPEIPVTTNFMHLYFGLNYWKFAKELDVISWDNYPRWHEHPTDWKLASEVSLAHDLHRSFKNGKPFMMMESTPSMTNWQTTAKLKRPGMHLLSSIQAIAHGSDTVQYFQWRKSRGASEKFHGAVIDHCGHENTRVFKDVAEVGHVLEKLDDIVGTTVKPDVAIILDWENMWAMEDAQGPRYEKGYYETCANHYAAFWKQGISVDIINMECDFSSYKLLVAPMLYMVRKGVAERIEKFVASGGILVTTYWSGIVDENDLCFLGGFPGPLRKVTGVWSEEIDAVYDYDTNQIELIEENSLKMTGTYEARIFYDLIHAETAKVLAVYKNDFYAGRPALTVNDYGCGKAYYMASRNEERFIDDFYVSITAEADITSVINAKMPLGVTAQLRTDGEQEFIFILNFTKEEKALDLGNVVYKDILNDDIITNVIELPAYGFKVLTK